MSFNKESYEYNQYLSFVDVERHPEWEVSWRGQDEDKVLSILYSFGCDVEKGYDIDIVCHRTRTTNQVEYGPRFSFKERVDKEWQKIGMQFEDMLSAQRPFLRSDLLSISKRTDNSSMEDIGDKGSEE